jgi:outer membrane protein
MAYAKIIKAFLLLVTSCSIFILSPNTFAENEKWKVRLRGIAIVPDDSSDAIILNNTTSQTAGVEVDSAFVPELDITYMITPNWGVEAIAGVANHDVNVDGTPTGALAAIGATDGLKLFDTWVLPPTVTLQYHFMPQNNLRPYIGAGVNYTAFLADDATSELEAAVGGPVKVSTENGWGWALQAGLDYDINESWFFNMDVKYIDIDTSAKLGINGGALAGNVLNVDVDVDPWVIGAGIGYRF